MVYLGIFGCIWVKRHPVCRQSNKDCAFRPDLLKHDHHKHFLFLVGLIIALYTYPVWEPRAETTCAVCTSISFGQDYLHSSRI
jgi:hypothetical protein